MKYLPYILLAIVLAWSISTTGYSQHKLIVKSSSEHLEVPAREPMLVEHPSGVLFAGGFHSESKSPQLWKSTDKGQHWTRVDVGDQSEGADGNSDIDLVIDEAGNLYFITLRYDFVNPEDSLPYTFN